MRSGVSCGIQISIACVEKKPNNAHNINISVASVLNLAVLLQKGRSLMAAGRKDLPWPLKIVISTEKQLCNHF